MPTYGIPMRLFMACYQIRLLAALFYPSGPLAPIRSEFLHLTLLRLTTCLRFRANDHILVGHCFSRAILEMFNRKGY